MPQPPTLRQIAAAAGVHHTTLSRALRRHPGVSAAKAEELRTLAEQMGYVPDPILRALIAYRTGQRPPAFHSVIAWLNPDTVRANWKEVETYRNYFESAAERARELGFQLEEVPLQQVGAKQVRITSMLRARNITGIIVGPMATVGGELGMIDWRPFTAVRIGESLNVPRLHAVTSNHAQGMTAIMWELRRRGYRRPGLFISRDMDERTKRGWSGAFLREQLEFPSARDYLRPYIFSNPKADIGEFVQWVKAARPDVIIAAGEKGLLPALREQAGLRVPEDIGLAALMQPPGNSQPISGLVENSTGVGRGVLDLLVAMVNRQERGVPGDPQTLQIDSQWNDHGTLRPLPNAEG